MKQSIAVPATELGAAREFIIGSVVISVLCLAFIIRERLGITDFFSVPIFRHLLIAHDYVGALLTVAILAGAFILRRTEPVIDFVRLLGRHPVFVAMSAFVMFSVGALLAYNNHPLSLDEYSPYLQSEAFAAGQLTGAFPPALVDWLIPFGAGNAFLGASGETGKVASYYMPGFALLLTPFTFLGVPWACNPALGAVSLLALHRLAKELIDSEEAGGWAMLFALASPAFSVNAMSYYSMAAHLLFNALYTLLIWRSTPAKSLAAGLVGGFALVLHNPFPHLLYAAPWIIWLVMRREWHCLTALVAGYLPFSVGLGAGWVMLTASIHSAPEAASVGGKGSDALGWLGHVSRVLHLPSADMVSARILGTVKLWVWAVPGLPLLAWFGFLASKHDSRCRLLFASAVVTWLGYFFIPFDQGHGWGYRYFHSAWGIVPVLGAAAIVKSNSKEAGSVGLIRIAGYAAIGSLLFATALRAYQVDTFMERHLSQIPQPIGKSAQIIFVDIKCGYYTTDLVQNHAVLKHKVFMMVSRGPEQNAQLAKRLSPLARLHARYGCGELWLLE